MVWDCLTLNGLLSEFNVQLNITDKSTLPAVTKQKQKEIRKRLKSKIGSNKYSTDDNNKIKNDSIILPKDKNRKYYN